MAGFINLGTSKNRQTANFQYVAPLMAYFNPSLDDNSSVHHFDSGKGFCLWFNEEYTNVKQTYICMLPYWTAGFKHTLKVIENQDLSLENP